MSTGEKKEFDFSKEIEMPVEVDTGSLAESVKSISKSSAGTEEMELYDDDNTKVMEKIPHKGNVGVLADLPLLPEDETGSMPELSEESKEAIAELEAFEKEEKEAKELVKEAEEPEEVESVEDELDLAETEAEAAIVATKGTDAILPEDELTEDVPVSKRDLDELGDLSYHDEDVKRERRPKEHSHHEASGERKRPQGHSGEHRSSNGSHSGNHSANHRSNHSGSHSSKSHSGHEIHVQGAKGSSSRGVNSRSEKRKFGIMDWVLIGGGVVALIVVAIVLSVFMKKSKQNAKAAELAVVGEKIASLGGIGQTGIDNIVADKATTTIESVTVEDDPTVAATEEISVNFVSIEKDLKIKFSNKTTDALIKGVLFKVEAKTPDNKEVTWEDTDKDGIIYQENIKPGKYLVKIVNVDKYKFPDQETEVTVKEKISYTAINIVNEIKKESEINVAQEDDKTKEIDEGVKLQDTVAWVDSSTKTAYQEVAKTDVVDPTPKQAKITSEKKALSAEGTVNGITLTPASMELKVGETGTISATVDASEEASKDVEWSSSDESVATVSGGVVTAVKEGTAVITCKSKEDDTKSATCSITVTAAEQPKTDYVKTLTLSDTSKELAVDAELQLTATVDVDGNASKTVTWTTSDATIATVGTDGKVKALKVGTATITCTTEGKDADGNAKTATCTITVVAKAGIIKTFALKETKKDIFINGTYTPEVAITTEGENVDKTVTWKTADATIATVDEKTGLITGIKEGTVNITATTKTNGPDGKPLEATCTITVKANSAATDTTTPLKDKNGNALYVKDGENYREAKSADYFKFTVFYLKKTIYTGWQTIGGKTLYYKADGNYVTGEQVIGGVKYNFANDGSLSMGGGMMGIDVSSWNGNINWTAVKNSGVSFVIIRCGYRGYTQGGLIEDSKFHTYASGAEAAGLKVGVYFFSQAINEREAVEEASMAIAMAKQHKISYPIFIDSEYGAANHNGRADKLDKTTRTAVCKAFCETIKSAGYTPGVYASKSWYYNNLNAAELNNYKIWLAHYCSQTDYKGKYELWQSSNTGRINGISGNVDINTSYLGY
ncbi:MAG: Ig-like domain-containing protein [Lachnospiraceae bacterium]|nr:Ig-like domain-containing protein [Lachnospiraceae bacterium]